MKLALHRFTQFFAEAQKYLPAALMAYTVIAILILRNPPNGDGGPGG